MPNALGTKRRGRRVWSGPKCHGNRWLSSPLAQQPGWHVHWAQLVDSSVSAQGLHLEGNIANFRWSQQNALKSLVHHRTALPWNTGSVLLGPWDMRLCVWGDLVPGKLWTPGRHVLASLSSRYLSQVDATACSVAVCVSTRSCPPKVRAGGQPSQQTFSKGLPPPFRGAPVSGQTGQGRGHNEQ